MNRLDVDLGASVPGKRILLVEDNPADVELTRDALQEAGIGVSLAIARDGVEAMEYLSDHHNPRPDLVLLDLNMPRKNGHEVLAEMKADERLRSIPVIVLTTSSAESDVRACYERHANGYVNKPVGFDDFVELMVRFRRFWLESSRLPAS